MFYAIVNWRFINRGIAMIIMLFQKDAFKEILLPNVDNTDYKIFIDKKDFNIKKSFHLMFEVIDRKWRIKAEDKSYQLIHHKLTLDTVEISGEEIVTIKTVYGEIIKGITFDSEFSLASYQKYDLIKTNEINIGKAEDNTIVYEFMNLISKSHCSIVRYNRSHIIYDYSVNGVFVNNKRIHKSCSLKFGDVISIFGLKIVYLGEIIALGSYVGEVSVNEKLRRYSAQPVGNMIPSVKHSNIFFNRSPRIFPSISTEEVVIEPPTTPQFTKKKSLLTTLGPSLTMAIPMLLGCGIMIVSAFLSGSAASAFMFTGIITALGSAVLGSLWAFINIRETKKNEIADEAQRFNMYGNYLLEMAEYIKEKYRLNSEAMYTMYPSAGDCCRYNELSSELWSRNNTHKDFLFCRLGTGDIDFQVDIKIPKEKFSVTYDSLKDKPAMLYENFKILQNVPVGVDLGQHSVFGIAGGKHKAGVYDIVNNIIVKTAANISYTDVKIAFCYDSSKDNTDRWDYIKWLPHVWSENKKMRYFATNRQEAADVFFELSNILRRRAEQSSQSYDKVIYKPHYFLFISDVSMLDGELISKYVFDKNNNYGLTTFILTDFYQNLPNICENIIENDESYKGSYNVINTSETPVNINFDRIDSSELMSFAKRISNIMVRESEDDTSIANSLDFFEMYNADSLEDFGIEEQWRKNRTYNSMKALIGKKAGGADCYLDIHEKYHGPHGLVAGTTGSGKSELIQTLMLSLAINYSPDDIAFFVIDFKGGGMANLFDGLPHMAGQISNLSGNQIGRAMISIKSENLRRQKIFNEFGVNNINLYTRLYKSGEAPMPIPHLLIIIDEFAELKKEEPDFMRELISVAQVGRSLGVHLILATQKPSGTVDDNIWSNAKFRLCLRVQDRQDSNDMLHKPDAAYITQAGRCYLQVGNDEIFELFQSGWSGAVYDDKKDGGKSEIATMITATGKTAIVGSHTKMKRKEAERFSWYKFLLNCIRSVRNSVDFNSEVVNYSQKFALKVIEEAKSAGYNIGNSNSEISAVMNFEEMIPSLDMPDEEIISSIIQKSSQNNKKLPEVKEKTQLEAIVEYIKKVAIKENYKAKTQLWMPLLEKLIVLDKINDISYFHNGWDESDKWTLDCIVGLYDDPQNQSQLPFRIDFARGGHLAVCGSVVSGKSTFLQTLVYSLAIKYSPSRLNFYLLDYSSGMLGAFEKLPHTGGVIRENDIDKAGKFFNMISSIIEERKKLFKGGNFSQFVKVNGVVVPAIIIVIDNFAGFKEKTENRFDEIIINLARDGVGYGIFLAISAAGFGMNEIQNRIGDNIRTVVSLEMSDKFKYMDVLRSTHIDIIPESGIKGRGIGYVEGRLLEFQTAVAVDADDDYKRNSRIEEICCKMRGSCNSKFARQIPFIPENPTYEDLSGIDEYKDVIEKQWLLPVGYNFEDASVYSIDLMKTYCYSITGKGRTGKTNLLRLIMLAALKKNGKYAVIEKSRNELCGFKAENISYLQTDAEILEYFKSITDDFIQRNKLKKELADNGFSDEIIFEKMQKFPPIFIFVSDVCEFIESVYHPEGNVGNMSGFFENIFEKGFLHNIYFFGCINTDDAASVTGFKAYHLFTAYRTGAHLGGNVAAQRIFNFQNIHYSQVSKSMKKGEALVPSSDDDTVAEKVIIPLVGGNRE